MEIFLIKEKETKLTTNVSLKETLENKILKAIKRP